MDDPTLSPRARRSRPSPGIAVIAALVALAFLAGLVLMGYLVRQGRWFGVAPTTAPTTAAARPGGAGFTPAQPLTASGEIPMMADPVALVTREAALAAQLSVLEARTAKVTGDATAAGTQATRAESLLVAFAARRAIDRGQPLGYLEEQLRARFAAAQPRAVAAAIEAGRQPVTLEDLRQGLDAIAPDISSGSTDDDWGDVIRRELGKLVVLRRAGTPSPLPADRLERARRLLAAGQVEAARAEVARLPGADQATNWMSAARRYVLARQALDGLETAAILGQGKAPPVPPPRPTSPTLR